MARAPKTAHAKARAAFILGQITKEDYAECIQGWAHICGRYVVYENGHGLNAWHAPFKKIGGE